MPHIDAQGWIAIGTGVLAVIGASGAALAVLRWVVMPHFTNILQTSIKEHVGSQLAEVPKLTGAVRELTGAIERNSQDTERLSEGLERLSGRFSDLSQRVGELSGRTETLENMITALIPQPAAQDIPALPRRTSGSRREKR